MVPTETETVTVSPNPSNGQIHLDGNTILTDSNITIANTSGKEIYRSKSTSKTFDLQTTLPAGIYILNLQTKDKKIHSRKIILTR
ncbi:T9SS type A sorting domain-containing protein [Chryseobacterium sp. c4a]|uniref:T9SS type A sorting domain-containing protein n=1 Tax=Chryseobacterium sp. c4a TaxID=1573582 RepID=UPI0039777696